MCKQALRPVIYAGLAWLLLTPAMAQGQFFVQGQPVSSDMYQAASLVNEGLAALRANQNQQAADKLGRAVQLAPRMAEAHHNLGLALAKLGRTQEAIDELSLALSLKPDLDSSMLTLGGLYQSTGQIDMALKTYREFISRFPQSSEAGKISNLIKGLENVSRNLQPAPGQLLPGNSNFASDYLAEMTRQGILRWPEKRMPIKVFIPSAEGLPGFRPSMPGVLGRAFEDWSAASGGRVQFTFVPGAQDADIECIWLADPGQLANTAEAGEARVFNDRGGISRGSIKLLTVPVSPELPLTDNRLRQICLHEIGHVLGMAGHTTNPADAMFYSSSMEDQWRSLSARDSNTVIKLYSVNSAGR